MKNAFIEFNFGTDSVKFFGEILKCIDTDQIEKEKLSIIHYHV